MALVLTVADFFASVCRAICCLIARSATTKASSARSRADFDQYASSRRSSKTSCGITSPAVRPFASVSSLHSGTWRPGHRTPPCAARALLGDEAEREDRCDEESTYGGVRQRMRLREARRLQFLCFVFVVT